jgi:ribose/xylose/arabinose/galactoside ABC-type transport system permease subunit
MGEPLGDRLVRTGRSILARNGLAIFFATLVIIFAILRPEFVSAGNIINVLRAASIIGIVACGMTVVMVAGGFDLSVARCVALAGILVALLQQLGPLPAIGMTLGACAGIGLVNGVLIVKAKVNPFVVTLGMLSIAGSASLLLTNGEAIYRLEPWLIDIAKGSFGPIPNIVVWFALVAIGCHVLLAYSRYGRYVYAVGGSYEASRLAGIRADVVTAVAYVLVALLAGVAGIVLTSRLQSASPVAFPGGELDVIAAVIIGGTRLGGGSGSIPGTVIGVLILASLSNGLVLLGVAPYWQGVLKGSIIIGAVAFDVFQRRRRTSV